MHNECAHVGLSVHASVDQNEFNAGLSGGLIGYGGTETKTQLPNKTTAYWNGFILSRDLGRNWYKGPNLLPAEVVGYPGHPGYGCVYNEYGILKTAL